MPRPPHAGRHELGQNFLVHRPTLQTLRRLVDATRGPILELGAGDGAVTRTLAASGLALTAVEIDVRRMQRLARSLPAVDVVHADALRHPIVAPVVVGNVPFHLTTPILRRLLHEPRWTHAVLVVQWEVARKRAGVGGGTLMTAQSAPWFAFALHGRVPAHGFSPAPGVDGGILTVTRRAQPLLPAAARRDYDAFARRAFTGSGATLARVVARAEGIGDAAARRALDRAGLRSARLPRDVSAEGWPALYLAVRGRR